MRGAMSRKWLKPPAAPSARGEADGRPYLVWLPKTEPPWPGMVIVHGAGSSKENHADFGRRCAAAGWAALAYDQRGHGSGTDEISPEIVTDCGRMARVLGGWQGVDATRICVRGSSMGGFVALHAAATSASIAAAIAICPAGEEHLLRGLREDSLEFRASPRARGDLEAWLTEHDVRDAVELIGAKPKILLHAAGDERIPSEFSAELHARAVDPRKLVIVPGGHHRSVQHDGELQGVALRWIERSLDGRAPATAG